MPLEITLFPPGLIALNKELATDYHPGLAAKLSNHPVGEWEIRVAEIAAHCEVILDGDYDEDSIDRLGFILRDKLIKLRGLMHS